jgi:hypothetical protein
MNIEDEILLCCTDIVVDRVIVVSKYVIGFYGHTSNVQGLETLVFCISGYISGFYHGVDEVFGCLDSLITEHGSWLPTFRDTIRSIFKGIQPLTYNP